MTMINMMMMMNYDDALQLCVIAMQSALLCAIVPMLTSHMPVLW